MRVSHNELEELKSATGTLGERLQSMGGVVSGQRSLHSEMECDDSILPVGDEYHQVDTLLDQSCLTRQFTESVAVN